VSRNMYDRGRLTARPGSGAVKGDFRTGIHKLNLDKQRDGCLYIPATYTPEIPCALAVMLHGAGRNADHGLSLIKDYADKNRIIILAPASREYSWDIIALDKFGPDVIFIDEALACIFENYAVDTNKIAIGGFSDGASYALCLGLSNGDLFTHVLAFSPGFVYTRERTGNPVIFISHGTHDDILPIKPCSERIVKELKTNGFSPVYRKFDGRHEIPPNISQAAINWFLER
jgi:phospholipase/carboxylesterase